MNSAKKASSLKIGMVTLAMGLLVLCGCKRKSEYASLTPQESHQAMLVELEKIAESSKSQNPFFGNSLLRSFEAEASRSKGGGSAKLLFDLGNAKLNRGLVREAIEHFENALAVADDGDEQNRVGEEILKTDVLYWLGVANLRLGEIENCCAQNNPDSCILPIQGEGVHTRDEGSRKAIEYFSNALRNTNRSSETNVRSRWLINIAYMTLGEYPDCVPENYLIDPDFFESEKPFPRFTNVTKKLGLDTFSSSGGAIVDDFDNDGDFDLVVSDYDPSGQLRFFRNQAAGGFVDQTESANLKGLLGGLNLIQADFNNDGWLDIFVLRGGWFKDDGQHPNSLLRNNGDGSFTDITFRAGLANVNYPTQTASWGDFDLDGDLDLYVGNEPVDQKSTPSQLFRNNGDETFTDVAGKAGVTNDRFAKAVIWGDYDNDLRPDIYVSNFGASNRLYHNNGDGSFTDRATELGVTGPNQSFPCWFWDFDNDGKLDIFVSSYSVRMDHVAADAMKFSIKTEKARLYKNTGDRFRNVAASMGIDRPSAPMGSNFGDLNGDGYLDFYLGTGWPDYDELMPNQMHINEGGKKFVDVTMASGFGHLQKGHAVVFSDLDQDGDQDVFEEMGGAQLGDKYYNAYFENPGFGNHWIAIKLVGTETNRSAIGARIRVDIEEDGKPRSIYRRVNSGGTFGANPLCQQIGLGKSDSIKLLEIEWPVSNSKQQFKNVGSNQSIQITEGAKEFVIKIGPAE